MNKVLFSSDCKEWGTPIDLFLDLDREFHFNVDLCASKQRHLCDIYFTKDDSCLDHEIFFSSIFCNPPYGRDMYQFIKKCYELSFFNDVVLLVPARTDTKWFHEFIYHKCDEIRFLKGRLKFVGTSFGSAPFPSMICIFKKKVLDNFR